MKVAMQFIFYLEAEVCNANEIRCLEDTGQDLVTQAYDELRKVAFKRGGLEEMEFKLVSVKAEDWREIEGRQIASGEPSE